MILLAVGCSYRTTPVDVRERLAFDGDQLAARPRRAHHAASAARPSSSAPATASSCTSASVLDGPTRPPTPLDGDDARRLPGRVPRPAGRRGPAAPVRPPAGRRRAPPVPRGRQPRQPDRRRGPDRRPGEEGLRDGPARTPAAGPLLHALFRHARQVARRVRTETGIARGHVSVSSAAVDYVRQVFDHFGDKTILVIGAGKMGELTLRHLRRAAAAAHPRHQPQPGEGRGRGPGLRRRGACRGSSSTSCWPGPTSS